MVVQYKGGNRYICNFHRQQFREPVCQYVPADPIDHYVVCSFFEALTPAELNLYDGALQTMRAQRASNELAHRREIQRLQYESDLALRQYSKVDPENRLVASELERRWEIALGRLQVAREKFDRNYSDAHIIPLHVSPDLRRSLENLGRSLPDVWSRDVLNRSQKKALIRCLVDKVVIKRSPRYEQLQTRIVWKGGAFTEESVTVPVGSFAAMSQSSEFERGVLELEAKGMLDEEIADTLTQRGLHSPMSKRVLPSTVRNIRLRHGRIHRFRGPRPRRVEGALTLPQVADILDVKRQWLYYMIKCGKLEIRRDAVSQMYLFPDDPDILESLRSLRDRKISKIRVSS